MVLVVGAPEDVTVCKGSTVGCTWVVCEGRRRVWHKVWARQHWEASAVAVGPQHTGKFLDQIASCAVAAEACPHRNSAQFPGLATVGGGFVLLHCFLLLLETAHLYQQAWPLHSWEQQRLCCVGSLEKIFSALVLRSELDWLSHLLAGLAFFHPQREISVWGYDYLMQGAGYKEVFETRQALERSHERLRYEERLSGNPLGWACNNMREPWVWKQPLGRKQAEVPLNSATWEEGMGFGCHGPVAQNLLWVDSIAALLGKVYLCQS